MSAPAPAPTPIRAPALDRALDRAVDRALSRAVSQDTAPDIAHTASRPASLWPDSTHPVGAAGAASTQFSTTRFDPAADERARLQTQAAAAFDVCHPALALRAVLLVQGVLALVALGAADSAADWAARQAALAFGDRKSVV